jgi:hypothetical protein
MKKTILIALISLFSIAPAFAGAYYKSEPKYSNSKTCERECCMDKPLKCTGKGILWLVKLPFRIVTSAIVGVHDLIVDQDLEGFEDGYNVI